VEGIAPDGRPWSLVLSQAGRAELAQIVSEHLFRFTEREALQVLRHPYVSQKAIEEIVGARRFTAVREIRAAIARNPLTPRPDALRCLEDLTWRDLMEIGREVRTPPPVRRAANARVLQLLPGLALGEKISLAHFVDRDLFRALLDEADPAVFGAVLRNPRLQTDDVVAWLTTGNVDAARIELLSTDRVWSLRPPVRAALLRHRATPRAVALSILLKGSREEWRRVMDDPASSPLLVACAERLLLEKPVDSGDDRL